MTAFRCAGDYRVKSDRKKLMDYRNANVLQVIVCQYLPGYGQCPLVDRNKERLPYFLTIAVERESIKNISNAYLQ